MNATKRPWKMQEDGTTYKRWNIVSEDPTWGLIAHIRGPRTHPEVSENAKLIVRAVNSYDAMREVGGLFVDPEGAWYALALTYHVIQYNTEQVPPTSVPPSYDALRHPGYFGRLAIEDQSLTWLKGLIELRGREAAADLVRALARQAVTFRRDARSLVIFVTAGDQAVAIDARLDVVERERRSGGKSNWAGPDPTIAQPLTMVVFATTAGTPYVDDLSTCPPGATLLHVSLRDLAPAAVLGCDNVVDDVDHVLRAGTSLHLAEQRTGGRGFIRCSLPEVLRGEAPPRRSADGVVVFSPFGLGILDLAVGELAVRRVTEAGGGRLVERFLPADGEA